MNSADDANQQSSPSPVPLGFRLSLDVSARQLTDLLWFGGSPPRVVRLTEAGRAAWTVLNAEGVTDRRTGLLARRLTDAAIAHPVPPTTRADDVTIVVPAYERADDLARCLDALGDACPVVVVDDASSDPTAIERVCAEHGAMLVRRHDNGGPGATRNTGLAHVQTEFVAFVDSDCTPPRDWLAPLLAHLADPSVAAVAPRIVARSDDSWSGRFTRVHGSLDLGELPARVAPGTRVTYVPAAAFVARRAALTESGDAFDESLRVGEDVDLVWRLHEAGHRVRYEPGVEVPHREPAGWPALLARRFRYGTSAGPLARRHPGSLAPLVLHPWPTLTVAGLLARRPLVAAGAALAGTTAMARTLRATDVPAAGLLPAMRRAIKLTFDGLGRYATQFAAPALLGALLARRTRLAAATLLFGPPLSAWAAGGRSLDPVRYTIGAVADEVAYGAGVWAGSIRAGTAEPVRPRVVWRPLRIDAAPLVNRS